VLVANNNIHMISERQSILLQFIINAFVQEAVPISSSFVMKNVELGVSPATIRNDMVALDEEGYLRQPHTSAGRIPTLKGYEYYVENFLRAKSPSKKFATLAQEAIGYEESTEQLKALAKALSEVSGCLTFVAFAYGDVYYTGLSQLFAQPEFVEHDLVREISTIVDHMSDVVERVYHDVDELKIYLGEDNPFGKAMTALVVPISIEDDRNQLIGMIGPVRMDYDRNTSLMKFTEKIINTL
jgi:transcriptional regulator of heat shock response